MASRVKERSYAGIRCRGIEERKKTKQMQTPICDVQDGNEMRSRMKVK